MREALESLHKIESELSDHLNLQYLGITNSPKGELEYLDIVDDYEDVKEYQTINELRIDWSNGEHYGVIYARVDDLWIKFRCFE